MGVDYGGAEAPRWNRDAPAHYSDFCGRPEALALFETFGRGARAVDLGCGEGYFTRRLAGVARSVLGVDASPGMLRIARERAAPRGVAYFAADVCRLPLAEASFDAAAGACVTNHIPPGRLPAFYRELARVLRPGGGFVLLMPHPVLALAEDFGEAIRIDRAGYGYTESRGRWFPARLATAEGGTVEAGVYHVTLEDHLGALAAAGLRLTAVREPVFPRAVAENYPVFQALAEKVSVLVIGGVR